MKGNELPAFDKRQALDVIEDAITVLHSPEDCAHATGLCGAFYMCGLLDHGEWETLLERIGETPG